MTHKMLFIWLVVLLSLTGLFSLASQQATATPLLLPITDDFDDGATLWASSGSWVLSELNGLSGKGWGASASSRLSILSWNRRIDLTTAITPRLRFASNLTPLSPNFDAFIYITDDDSNVSSIRVPSSEGLWEDVVIDLTGYRGHQITITWVAQALGPSETDLWMIDDVVVEDTK